MTIATDVALVGFDARPERRPLRARYAAPLWLFAVLLPATSITVELWTRMCADNLFDPLPTFLHLALVCAVPLANAAALVAIQASARMPVGLAFANGLALGAACFYALVFAPLTPLAVMMVVAYGLGLLPLAPLLASVCGVVLWRLLRARQEVPTRAGMWGLATTLLALLAVSVPPAITRFELYRAAEGTPEQQAVALRMLRAVGDRELILRACYDRPAEIGDLATLLVGARHVTPAAARAIYYRVTGDAFDTVPPPDIEKLHTQRFVEEWDFEQGGENVGAVLRGLSLAGSSLTGSLDASAAVGAFDWTMTLRNTSTLVREARAVVALPPGAAVTGATLWFDGVEKQAVFGGRAAVRAVYQQVVSRRRDPLLVTSAGPDRVLVQCFPVPAGGTMKIRIHVSLPLVAEAPDRTRLYLPNFVERNFAVAPELRHELRLSSYGWEKTPRGIVPADPPAQLAASALVSARVGSGMLTLGGGLLDAELAARSFFVPRDAAAPPSWAVDRRRPEPFGVVERLEPRPRTPTRTIVVLDGSKSLAGEAIDLGRVLAGSRKHPAPIVVLAGDAVTDVSARKISADDFHGGMDNVPALVDAWDRGDREGGGLVVWVHGPQPVDFGGLDGLRQRCDRREGETRLIALAVAPGPNRVLDALDPCRSVSVAMRRGALADDLRALLDGGAPDGATMMMRRERVATASAPRVVHVALQDLGDDLVRLWAREEVDRRDAEGDGVAETVELAVLYGVVGRHAGAVVLEPQVEAEGLEPGSAAQVPTVPEPSLVALLAVLAAILVAERARRGWLGRAS